MKKLSKTLLMAAGIAALTVTGCSNDPEPVPYKTVEQPESEWHQEQQEILATSEASAESLMNFQTGWVQKDDSIEVSLSSPDNCQPAVEKVSKQGKVVSIYLKETPDDCSTNIIATYFTIEEVKEPEKVQIFEAGYDIPYEIFQQ